MKIKFLFVLVFVAFSLEVFSQSTRYVSTTGNDNSGNGTISNPYAGLQKALLVSNDNDTIILRGGNYPCNEVRIDLNNITIRSFEGEWAVLTAPINNENIAFCIWYHDPEIVGGTLERLEIIGGYYYGIKFESDWNWGAAIPDRHGVSNINIKSCIIHNTGRDCLKLTPASDNITIESCEIYNSGVGPGNTGNPNAEGIDVVNCDNLIVRNCYIHNTSTTGIYSKGGSINSLIEGNLLMNCGENGILLGFYTDEEWFDTNVNPNFYENINGTVRNNIIINTNYAGIGMYAAKNPHVYNNTVINAARVDHAPLFFNTGYIWLEALNDMYAPPTIDVMVYNNIFVLPDTSNRPIVQIRYYEDSINSNMLGNCKINYNKYYRPGGAQFDNDIDYNLQNFANWKTSTNYDLNSTEGNPQLDQNYHLTSSSTCIDNAFSVENLNYDYDGGNRNQPYDIGADEYNCGNILVIPPTVGIIGTGSGLTTSIKDIVLTENLSTNLFPNPCRNSAFLKIDLQKQENIDIQIIDLTGKTIKTVFSGLLNKNTYSFEINTENFNTGIFFIKIKFENQIISKKLLVIK